ncbi:MAG: helix-turn-helix domain-containing protein [Ignavibacteria bacterium]
MQSKELIYKLQQIGFKEYESKIFLVLLKGSALSASEIAEKANIRRTAVYEILKSFAARGFCNEIETNTILKYEMIDPRVIADKIENEIEENNRSKISNIKETFKEFETLHKSEESSENKNVNIELIRGFNRHRQEKFIELFNSANHEILFMIRLEGYVSEELESDANDFFKKGGVIKSVYEASHNFKIIKDSSRQDATFEDLLRICRRFESSGEQVRISSSELPNMTIFDKKIVFIKILDKLVPRHNNADIIIKNESFAKKMIDLFNYYWRSSYKIDDLKKAPSMEFNNIIKTKKQKSPILINQ